MILFIKKYKYPLGCIPFLVLFYYYIELANHFIIPRMEESSIQSITGNIINVPFLVSILSIFLFQFIYFHLVLRIEISSLILLNKMKMTLLLGGIFIACMVGLEFFSDTGCATDSPYNNTGLGIILELSALAYVEEIIFRGFLFMMLYEFLKNQFPQVSKKVWGFSMVILSSILFALVHVPFYSKGNEDFHWLLLLFPFLMGILLNIVYLNTRNLFVCILLHFAINYRFIHFPLTNTGLSLSFALFILVFIILIAIGQVIYKKGEVRFIDEP
jgi:membrane protease YdiL (CAAX protease family)